MPLRAWSHPLQGVDLATLVEEELAAYRTSEAPGSPWACDKFRWSREPCKASRRRCTRDDFSGVHWFVDGSIAQHCTQPSDTRPVDEASGVGSRRIGRQFDRGPRCAATALRSSIAVAAPRLVALAIFRLAYSSCPTVTVPTGLPSRSYSRRVKFNASSAEPDTRASDSR